MSITLSIFFIVIITLVALITGLVLRRLLVRRLRRTVLDNWLIQTPGIIVLLLPLIVAAGFVPVLTNNLAILIGDSHNPGILQDIRSQLPTGSITGFVWILVESLLLIVLGIGFARTVMKIAIHGLGRNRVDVNISTLVGRIGYIIIILIIVFWLFSLWNISIGLPVVVLGTLTVALTFAIQDILKNLFAGFYLLIERPFHIGDQITVGDETKSTSHVGVVEDVLLRATKLRLVSGEQLTVPNYLVFSGVVINNTFYQERRATIEITLHQDEYNNGETSTKILKVLHEIDAVRAKPEPTVLLSGYTGTNITLTVRFWVTSGQIATISEVVYTLRKVLPNADLTVTDAAGDI